MMATYKYEEETAVYYKNGYEFDATIERQRMDMNLMLQQRGREWI